MVMTDRTPHPGAPRIGVLALQGDFAAHIAILEQLGVEARPVRDPADLDQLDGLVIPGGESTTMLRLMERNGLSAALAAFVAERPTFGTCAGVILLAREVTHPEQATFGVLDITVERNGYGRQVDSFVAPVEAPTLGDPVEGVFIRAPRLRRVGTGVTVLGFAGGEPVLVEEGHLLGAAFHPELTGDSRVHRYFLDKVVEHRRRSAA
jgi:5'-phosphate synthase pdxT subunit